MKKFKYFFTQILTLLFFTSTCYGWHLLPKSLRKNPIARHNYPRTIQEPKKTSEVFLEMLDVNTRYKAYCCFDVYCYSIEQTRSAGNAIVQNKPMITQKKHDCFDYLLKLLENNYSNDSQGYEAARIFLKNQKGVFPSR